MLGHQQRYNNYYKETNDNDHFHSQAGSNDQHDGDGDTSHTNLIVNYLPQHMTEKDLYTLFVSQGPVDKVRIMKDFKTGYSFGFGFVKFVNPQDAARAIQSLNGIEYYNKRLKVSYARPSGQDIKDSNLYITNLPRNITDNDIDEMFGEYGTIVQKNILKDKIAGVPRGDAFVRYARRDDAQNAITHLNGKFLKGCLVPMVVKLAEKPGKHKATYYEGWQAGFQLNKGRPFDSESYNGGFRNMGRGTTVPRRGMPAMRGNFNGMGRGNHRFNPMDGGGDMGFSRMNHY